jgi:hypothetical protein
MAQDITIIHYTANLLPESFAAFTWRKLLEAAGDSPIISVQRGEQPAWFVPDDRPVQVLLDRERRCASNIYRQMLRAAKLATTEYVANAEDDCLYPPEHFTFHRPAADTFAYDQNRLALFTWGEPIYHWRNRKSNSTLIAPRKLLIEALEERFARWPDGTPDHITGEVGRSMVEKNLGITIRKSEEVFCKVSTVRFDHAFGLEERQRTRRKSYGPIRMYDIPRWGHARDLLPHFH